MRRLLLSTVLAIAMMTAFAGGALAQEPESANSCWGQYISGQASAQGSDLGEYVSGTARTLGRDTGTLVSYFARTCDF
jgi:hypothetical protein